MMEHEEIYNTFIHYNLDVYAENYRNRNKNIIIFGAGNYGMYLYQKLIYKKIRIYGICDNKWQGAQKTFDKIRHVSIEDIANVNDFDWMISVVDYLEKLNIEKQLLEAGVQEDNIYMPISYPDEPYFDEEIVEQHRFREAVVRGQWNHTINSREEHIRDFFKTNYIQKVAILADKEYYQSISAILKRADIKILRSATSFSKELCEDADALLILQIQRYEELEDEALDCFQGPIISFWELIR